MSSQDSVLQEQLQTVINAITDTVNSALKQAELPSDVRPRERFGAFEWASAIRASNSEDVNKYLIVHATPRLEAGHFIFPVAVSLGVDSEAGYKRQDSGAVTLTRDTVERETVTLMKAVLDAALQLRNLPHTPEMSRLDVLPYRAG